MSFIFIGSVQSGKVNYHGNGKLTGIIVSGCFSESFDAFRIWFLETDLESEVKGSLNW